MKDEHGYEIIPVQNVTQVLEYNQSNYRQLFVFDDVEDKVSEWKNYSPALQTRLNKGGNLKIIACCATHVYEDPKFQKIPLLCEYTFDLKAAENMLSDEDVESIATCHMRKNEVVAIRDIKEKLKKLDNFPFLCRKFADEKLKDSYSFFEKTISEESSNVKIELNTSNSLTVSSEQLIQDLFSNTKMSNCKVQIFNGGTHYHS